MKIIRGKQNNKEHKNFISDFSTCQKLFRSGQPETWTAEYVIFPFIAQIKQKAMGVWRHVR
jgi:hypothetical protein